MSVHQLLAVGAYTLTPGRFWSLVAMPVGLAGVVLGGWALVRSGRGARRNRAIVALAAGLVATVVGAVVVAAADGGPGTGHGIVGGVLAVVVGLAAVLLGGAALVRSRRAAGRGAGGGAGTGGRARMSGP
ncbi:DUF6223 family protein [Actinomycetospora cinnamomea]|uniref:Uncharacterized protein n=1 Tax=Actinomycetospora cinnamomea TaxID=663609 RepID=A0A2U1FLU9_9PSEU|nr:DUF6223 family protein [Actinomycetospora cinnamomea]PVZ13139.1 hypothetical protein C8D89_102289 [Actinomycetospora cinnamomea]